MTPTSHLQRIAIVGVGGHIGKYFAEELVKTGKHIVTALTRAESKSKAPDGVQTVVVDFADDDALISALQGQQFLVITLAASAPSDLHSRIVAAAVKAGVRYIMPNAYGIDLLNSQLRKDTVGDQSWDNFREIMSLGASYIVMVCGFWYHWSLALGDNHFGIDIKNRKCTMIDDGTTKMNVSTWAQCGRALAAFLSLPESAASTSPSVSDWKNTSLRVSSFCISQRDMLDSLHRVLGTTDEDWDIRYEAAETRYEKAKVEMHQGDHRAFVRKLYTRSFFANGDGIFETQGLANEVLGLPTESLDEATRETVKMVESGWSP